jgi:hypothetical protein
MQCCYSPKDVVARRMESEVEERFRIRKPRPHPSSETPLSDADVDNDDAPNLKRISNEQVGTCTLTLIYMILRLPETRNR